ncbi:hypothetical protein FJY68_06870 [candidate division WOR-3 bacterium]|uniref:Uncharacterized protein n=1 Tax=candidate division WOR-3 bacterium TaxID=2052148 RepID=A0A938BRE9_UNCW3|nr:hypothetical protein [candidate division WOR-3 bacterium]
MTSVGRTAAVILLLVAVAAAVPFAPGTRFGMVGIDCRISGGAIYSYHPDSAFSSVDPFFRAGICVTPSLALGADLALLNTFPKHGDMFLNTPVFAFSPVATWFPSEFSGIQTYGTVGTGVSYDFLRHQGWRFRLGAGALLEAGPVTVGTEIGWYADWITVLGATGPPWRVEPIWVSGSSFFFGLRLSDLRL